MATEIPSEAQVLEWFESLSNWGRWGDDDQKGCLNLITPAKRKQAAALVQDGVSVSCARPILTETAPDITHQVQRFMVDSGEGRDTDPPERRFTRRGAAEYIGMVFHGQTITHIDAPSHYSWNGRLYNGKPANLITSREGAQTHSIEVAFEGIVTKGVLLDIPTLRGIDWVPPNEPVMPADLEAAEKAHGVRVEEGDLLLVRTGNYRKRLDTGPSAATTLPLPARLPVPRGSRSAGWPCWAPTLPTTSVPANTPPLAHPCIPCAWSRWGCGSSTTPTWRS